MEKFNFNLGLDWNGEVIFDGFAARKHDKIFLINALRLVTKASMDIQIQLRKLMCCDNKKLVAIDGYIREIEGTITLDKKEYINSQKGK